MPPIRIRTVCAVFTLAALGALAQAADPVVRILYPPESATTVTLSGDATLPIHAAKDGVVYLTVDTPYVAIKRGETVVVHNTLHYVLGGYPAEHTVGNVRVNGPGVAAVGGKHALIDLNDGWVWASDQAPAGWSAHTAADPEPPVTAGVLDATPSVGHASGGHAVGWSIITLLRGRWSWAGAIGTELIYRVSPDTGDGSRLEVVYALDSASKSVLTLAADKLEADGGSYAGLKGRDAVQSRLSGRWLDEAEHRAFVQVVRDAVARVGRN
ncbi:MAG: hypothetical protein H6810_07460 [Phycisphaeraceae bacterium]|nr:MAG: hypothetical protein H6810_07460 [Phycisphaeraceae bacterium]